MANLIKPDDPGIQKVKTRMQALGLPMAEIERETSFALQIINRSKDLRECTPGSILGSILNVANIGLTLNPAAKESCLIARWNGRTKSKECTFEPMYGGLVTLATREGVVTSIVAQAVYQGDHFEARPYDNQEPVIHTFNSFDHDRAQPDNIVGFYAIATLRDGIRQAEIMSAAQVNEVRDGSDGYKAYVAGKIKDHPWVSHYQEMGRKTVLKRLIKYLPKKDAHSSKLHEAIEIDNQGYAAKHWQLARIDDLLRGANISAQEVDAIDREYEAYTYQQAQDCIAYLKDNQLPEHPAYDDRINVTKRGEAMASAVADEKK